MSRLHLPKSVYINDSEEALLKKKKVCHFANLLKVITGVSTPGNSCMQKQNNSFLLLPPYCMWEVLCFFIFFVIPQPKDLYCTEHLFWKHWTNFSSSFFFFLLLWINCRIVPIQCSWVVCVWTLLAEKFLMQQGWIYKSIIYSVIHTVDLFCRALFGNIHSSSLSGRVGAFELLKRWIHNSFFFLWSSEVTWIADVFLIALCLARLCPGRGVCDCPQVCALLVSCRWEQHLRIGCWTVLAVKGQAPIQHHFCPLLKFHTWRISWSVSSDRLKPFPVIFCSFKSTEY